MGQNDVIYDKEDQLRKIQQHLLPGEGLIAVFDLKGAGTGFIGITEKRLIFLDKAFLRNRKAMVTIPYSKITSIASGDEEGLVFKSSELTVVVGSHSYEFEFRGADKARKAYEFIVPRIL